MAHQATLVMVAPDQDSDSDLKDALVKLASIKPPSPNKKWDTYDKAVHLPWRLVIDWLAETSFWT